MSRPSLLDDISDTARWVAHYRAVESDRPDAIVRDPYARRLAGDRGRAIAEALPALSLDWVIPVRTRVFDELIAEALRDLTVTTVLDLAAGLDTRPYRLALPADLRWVEVDSAALLGMKNQALAEERPRCRLQRVPLDLRDQAARRALLAEFGRGQERVLVVTEGILAYLEEGVVASLAEDLFACPAVEGWVLEAAMPEVLRRARRGWGKVLARAGAEMKFAPAAGLDYFAPFGWSARSTRSLLEEARRLGRGMRFGGLARSIAVLLGAREKWRKTVLYAILERRRP